MYDRLPGLILGYHGCDRAIGEGVLSGNKDLRASTNTYDWLGHGIYFWEHNPTRAIEWAKLLRQSPRPGRPRIKEPMAIGAVIDLGFCLNLLDAQFLSQLPIAYKKLKEINSSLNAPLPRNQSVGESSDLLLRHLDCAVIETLHQLRMDEKRPEFDSARGVFIEGKPLYPGAAIQAFNHIQVCVRNTNCIKGYFRLREDV
ncbi:MAG: hypothetical protein ABSH08_17295 [Tepidisphaeraceae bacterium]|jgi:hypothetical protein